MPGSDEGQGSWQKVPVPSGPEPNARVYHYTNAQGVQGMLQHHTLWASATNMLNDGREIQHGLDAIGWELDSFIRSNKLHPTQEAFLRDCYAECFTTLLGADIYVICASVLDDSLSQWRGYAGTGGYAVGLDHQATLTVVTGQDTGFFKTLENRMPGWRTVLYDDDDVTDEAQPVFEFLAGSTPTDCQPGDDLWSTHVKANVFVLNLLTPCIKHSGFADEAEVRWAFRAEETTRHSATRLRVNNLGLVPYLEVTANEEAHGGLPRSAVKPRKLPIQEIVIGPCPYPEAASRGLRAALNATGYDDVEVRFSEIPYR